MMRVVFYLKGQLVLTSFSNALNPSSPETSSDLRFHLRHNSLHPCAPPPNAAFAEKSRPRKNYLNTFICSPI